MIPARRRDTRKKRSLCALNARSLVTSRLRSKGKDKRKAFVSSIWVNSSDDEASDEEEIANLCLVAREEDEEASSDLDLTNEDHEVTLPELQEAYNEVHEEFSRLCKAYKVLKTKKESLESKRKIISYKMPWRSLPMVQKC